MASPGNGPPRGHLAYRPDVDGLRAVAVVPVVLFHAFPNLVGGGFVGVDIFFVISGYLISNVILTSIDQEVFSIRGFYARRIKRIFPALTVAFVVCLAFGWVFLLGPEYRELGKHVAGGAAFISNFVLLGESGYFDGSAESKVLLHLWSLGVEEQFYIVWPVVLVVATRRRWSVALVAAMLLAFSFLVNVVWVKSNPSAAFYSPLARSWELLAGALLSWAFLKAPQRFSWITGNAGASQRSLLGILLICAAVALIRKGHAFPGAWALLPVAGAALVISGGADGWINRHVLSRRALVFIGTISYPLYIWHWPLLVFRNSFEFGYKWWMRVAAVAAAVVLAWLTARWVERPIRSEPRRAWKVVVPTVAMAALLIAGSIVFVRDGFPWRLRDVAEYVAYFENSAPKYQFFRTHDVPRNYRFDCDFYDFEANRAKTAIDPSCYTPHSGEVVVLWGDSHAQHLYYGLSTELPSSTTILTLASSACPPSLGRGGPVYCEAANRFALDRIREVRPSVVVLAQASEHETTDFEAVGARLREFGVRRVLLLGPVPHWFPPLHKIIARYYWPRTPDRLKEHVDGGAFRSNERLRATYGSSPTIDYVSMTDALCDARGCLTYLDGDRREGIVTHDEAHLTARASVYVARATLLPRILPALR